MIASPDPPAYYPEVEGMTPAWRDSIVHLVYLEGWHVDADRTAIDSVYDDITRNKVQALRDLSPETGAYFNECDSFEPAWQDAFFGPNYPRLYAIKQKYDPQGVLWCNRCVGSEAWAETDGGQLCRTEQYPSDESRRREVQVQG